MARPLRLAHVGLLALLGACGSPARLVGQLDWQGPVMPSFASNAAGHYYRYAPSVVETDPSTRHAYVCGNVTSDEIKDHLLHRVAHRSADGAWIWSEETVALAPSDPVREPCTGFDCYHVCDPEYLEGTFRYRAVTYTRALLYTGNDLDASAHNSIGLALATAPEGPWVRYALPLVSYESQCGTGAPVGWGVGQPSATSIDGSGHVMLFARVQCGAAARPTRWDVDLSTLDDAASPALGTAVVLPFTGLTKGNPTPGAPDTFLNDASFAYDAGHDLYFVVRAQHPLPHDAPTNIPTQLQISSAPGTLVRTGLGSWTSLGDIAPVDDGQDTWATGLARNHNASIVRTPHGAPIDVGSLEIAYTTCDAAPGNDWLWTDRIWSVRGVLRE